MFLLLDAPFFDIRMGIDRELGSDLSVYDWKATITAGEINYGFVQGKRQSLEFHFFALIFKST